MAISVRPQRRSIRLYQYDYRQSGAYFVTICTYNHQCLFGKIIKEQMELNRIGKIVAKYWLEIPKHFKNIELDAFIVMPNHIHGILVITESPVGVMNASPEKYTGRPNGSPLPRGPQQQSIGAIIGSFKSALTKWVNEIGNKSGYTIWQRNYFEHIIRSGEEFNHIREYIRNNPMMWGVDRENLLVNQQFIKNTKRQSWQV